MPCRSDEAPTGEPAEREVDRVTRLLCGLCINIECTDQKNLMTPELQAWWQVHKTADQKRISREQIRRAALKKLTPAEREALGHPRHLPGD